MRTRSGFEYDVAGTEQMANGPRVQKIIPCLDMNNKKALMTKDFLAGCTQDDLMSIFEFLKAGKIKGRKKSGYHFECIIPAYLKTSPFVKPHIKIYEQGKRGTKRIAGDQ